MKAMLFAAGLGTRLKPFTEKHPKALVEINGKTLLERNINYLKSFGICEIVINIHHFADQILDYLQKHNYFNCIINISHEKEKLLETGGGLVYAQKFFDRQSFLVMNADILTNMDLLALIKDHHENQSLVTLAVSDRQTSRKLYFNEDKKLVGWKNLQTQQKIFINSKEEEKSIPLAFSGIQVLQPEIFSLITQEGKFSLIDTYLDLMRTQIILGYKHQSYILDVGKPESIKEAEKHFK